MRSIRVGGDAEVVDRLHRTDDALMTDDVAAETVALRSSIGRSSGVARPLGPVDLAIKRSVDILGSICLLILVSPLMLLVAAAVRLSSPGPAIFRQRRVGLDGEEFVMLKFRTLRADQADAAGRHQATLSDPRVTPLGRWLRLTSLDELPQLWNIILGDMSLVGPRPHAPATEVEGMRFASALPRYDERHRVKPGLTGLAQVNGWRGPTPTIAALEHRLENDLEYIERWSLRLDLAIMLRTLGVPFTAAAHAPHPADQRDNP